MVNERACLFVMTLADCGMRVGEVLALTWDDVVLTHDPKFDYPALLAAIRSPARYVGAIGSKNTNSKRMEALREMGATDEQLSRIFAPVGLNLGARSPSEIALAVMAEIVAQRYSRNGGHLKR